jgi:hypothetical protein
MRVDQPDQEKSTLSFVDTLVTEFGHKEDSFDVTIIVDADDKKSNIVIPFRRIVNFNEWQEMKRQATTFARKFRKGKIEDAKIVKYVHFDTESLMLCFLFKFFCKDERFNCLYDWFTMAEELPLWFEDVKLQFLTRQSNSSMFDLNDQIDKAKND